MKLYFIATALALAMALQACSYTGKPPLPPAALPATAGTPSNSSQPPNGATLETAKPSAPLAISAITIQGGTSFGDWTLVPRGPFSIEVTAEGTDEVTLVMARYPSGPDPVERKPNEQDGNRHIFHVDISESASYQVAGIIAQQGDQRMTERRQVFMLKPEATTFTTVAKGSVSGWAAEKDRQVREWFREGQVYWFDAPDQYEKFAANLKAIVGLNLPSANFEGQTAIVLLGAPTEGVRPYEAVQLGVPALPPGSAAPEQYDLEILMRYSATPTIPGPTSAPYHVLLVDTRVYKLPGTLTIYLRDGPFAKAFAETRISLKP